LRSAVYYISVPKCTACRKPLGKSGLPLCESCLIEYRATLNRGCSVCGELLSHCSCAGEYLKENRIKGHIKLFRYDNREENRAANSLIYSAKRTGREDVITFISSELTQAVRHSFDNTDGLVITSVPRSKRSLVKYGFDHAEGLAKRVADELSAEYIPLLCSNAKGEQKKMDREARLKNARFDLISTPDLTGKTVIIIDDIVTTGASMVSAAREVRKLGRRITVYSASVSMAYRDEFDYVYF